MSDLPLAPGGVPAPSFARAGSEGLAVATPRPWGPTDWRVVLSGAGLALAAGLLLGGAMKPDLLNDDLARGPQQLAALSGVRAAPPVELGAAMAAYGTRLPTYVLGPDAARLAAEPQAAAPDPMEASPAPEPASEVAAPATEPVPDAGENAPLQ
jgi:hypothetical protein